MLQKLFPCCVSGDKDGNDEAIEMSRKAVVAEHSKLMSAVNNQQGTAPMPPNASNVPHNAPNVNYRPDPDEIRPVAQSQAQLNNVANALDDRRKLFERLRTAPVEAPTNLTPTSSNVNGAKETKAQQAPAELAA